MAINLPKGRQAQVVARPTVDNSRRQATAADQSAKSFASNADNLTTGVVQTDVLPLATATTPGIVQPDEVTIHVDTSGIINAITATTSSLGIVEPDNVTIVIDGSGIISATGAGAGTVTSVGLALPVEFTVTGSPVTTAGTLTGSWANETANLVFAGPNTGSPGTPSFRVLVTADIPNSIVTYAKIQNETDNTLLGRSAGSAGAPMEIAIGSGLSLSGGTLTSTGTGGTVTSVALTAPAIFSVSGSPITTSGTLAITLANETANTVWAGPTTGSPATPTFRALVSADIPNLGANPTATAGDVAVNGTATTYIRSDGAPAIQKGSSSLFGIVKVDNTTITASSGVISTVNNGTVTSVALTMPAIFSVAGSPITTSGTLAVTLATETANTIWSGPTSGGAATPTFRSLVAADIPSLPYISTTLTNAHILVGNGSNVATDVAVSGDVSLINTGEIDFAASGIAKINQRIWIGI